MSNSWAVRKVEKMLGLDAGINWVKSAEKSEYRAKVRNLELTISRTHVGDEFRWEIWRIDPPVHPSILHLAEDELLGEGLSKSIRLAMKDSEEALAAVG